jgi:hypothetical protein
MSGCLFNFDAFLLLFILFVALVTVGVCMLAAINEKLRTRQQKEQESENE